VRDTGLNDTVTVCKEEFEAIRGVDRGVREVWYRDGRGGKG